MDIEAGLSAGDHEENIRRCDRTQNLRDDVGNKLGGREAFAYNQPQADSGVQVAAGDVSDGEGHGEDGETEGQRHAGESYAERGESCGQDRRAASAEH